MPVIINSTYKPPLGFKNPHLQSIFPQIFRSVKGINYTRERICTPDNDFLDLDWCLTGKSRCAILIHGLEGHTFRAYILGMVKLLQEKEWDTVSMNLRGCSGEPNRNLRMYHHGVTDDLYTVIKHVISQGFKEIVIAGFSLGANMILKYLGEKQFPVPSQLLCSIAISTPCDLTSCALKMDHKSKQFYTKRFLKMLYEKIRLKKEMFPDVISDEGYHKIKTFKEYDDRYTAPIHGFISAEDYYRKNASLQFLEKIDSPVLLINAKDDPFLTPECFPYDIAEKSRSLFFEAPSNGGHVGFISFDKNGYYWHENRAVEFIEEIMHSKHS